MDWHIGIVKNVPLAAWVAALAAGCDERAPSRDQAPAAGVVDERPAPADDLAWSPCALETGATDLLAECATAEVPLLWEDPAGEKLEIFVKRLVPTSRPRGQLWLLSGGPGGAGSDFESMVSLFVEASGGDLVVYMPDHRGTGRSARLACDDQSAATSAEGAAVTLDEWAECGASLESRWGDGLAGFSVEGAARDLDRLIGRTRRDGEQVFVFSVSYGTLWAQRLLHVTEQTFDGVVFDSICSEGACEIFSGYDDGFDQVGRALLALCDADPECGGYFEAGAEARLVELYDKLDAGHCPELGLDRFSARSFVSVVLQIWPLRDYVPGLIHRMHRCSSADLEVLGASGDTLDDVFAGDPSFSPVLNRHITISEMATSPRPDPDELQAHLDENLFGSGFGTEYRAIADRWPTYVAAPPAGRVPDSSVPALLMNGTLDPQTTLADAAALVAGFSSAHQTYVEVPFSAHTVLTQSPLDERATDTCGLVLLRQFLDDPRAALDTRCTSRTLAPRFAGWEIWNDALFDGADAFGGDAEEKAASAAPRRDLGLGARVPRWLEGAARRGPLWLDAETRSAAGRRARAGEPGQR